jgi:hypothetical protein
VREQGMKDEREARQRRQTKQDQSLKNPALF